MKQQITAWFYRNFVNISFPQLNMLSLWAILIFTILFTWLTIQEEYKVFEKNFYKDVRTNMQNQQRELDLAANRIAKLIAFEFTSPDAHSHEAMVRIAEVFSGDREFFVNLYAARGALIYGTAELRKADLVQLASGGEPIERQVMIGGESQNAMMKHHALGQGYSLVLGIPRASSDELMAERKTELKRRLTRIILEFVTLAFIIFGFMLGINTIYNALLKRDVNAFLEFFSIASGRDAVINPRTIFFAEFKKMVEYANDMVTALATHKRSLESLNLSLEDKVREKTAALEVKNFALEKEKAFSQKLLQSQKEFMRHAIHETNTPLSVIVANLDLYSMKYGKNVYLSKIDASVKNLFNIFDDLAYLVKKDQVEYPKKTVDLCTFAQSRLDFFSEVAEQAGLKFAFECIGDGCPIRFNETKLQRIIDNNLTNAIKYTLKHGVIDVKVVAAAEHVRFSIASHSQLIEDTEKVFEPFYRERSSEEGFGLGLNLVKSICADEGVAIELESDEARTCFTYTFTREHESTVA